MFKVIMIILGSIFISVGFSGLFSAGNAYNPMSLISILSGLLMIARGIKYSKSRKKESQMDLTEYKIYASRLYLKGKSDKRVRKALLRKGLPEQQVNQLIEY